MRSYARGYVYATSCNDALLPAHNGSSDNVKKLFLILAVAIKVDSCVHWPKHRSLHALRKKERRRKKSKKRTAAATTTTGRKER